MSKFHVNGAGNPGKCRAVIGLCPFGSIEEHHDSPESARVAFEKKNAGKQLPVAVKKVSRREKKEADENLEKLHNNYDSKQYDNLNFSDVVFDHTHHENRLRSSIKRQHPKLSRSEVEDAVSIRMNSELASWERRGRTEPAQSFERDVPVRLLPVGTEVVKDDENGNPVVVGVIAEPEPRHDVNDFVATIKMNDGTVQSREANEGVSIGKLGPAEPKSGFSPWERETSFAETIKTNREKISELNK